MIDDIKDLNLHLLTRDILRHIWMVVLAFIGVKLIVWSYLTLTFVPRYTSSVTLAVSTRNASTVYTDLSTASSMAKVLEEVLDSSLMTDVVNEQLGEGAENLKYACTVIPNTNLLTISVTGPNARSAFSAVSCVMDNYQDVVATVMDNAVFHVIQQPAVAFRSVNSPNASRPSNIGGLMAALAVIWMIIYDSYKRPTFKRESDITKLLNVKLLGSLPHEAVNKSLKAKLKKVNKGVLITNASSSFTFVEQVRQLRTRFEQMSSDKNAKTVVFTSLLENEGKSTVIMNLAIALAQKGKRVLVVDADLRKPAVYKLVGQKDVERNGLESLLTGDSSMRDVIRWEAPFYLWSCAGSKTLTRSAEWLGSRKMRELLELWRANMDYVLIDAPPLDVATDAEAMAGLCDGSVLVVREDYAPVEAVNEVIDNLSRCNAKFLGCVFNDSHINSSMNTGFGGHRYSKDYDGYRYADADYQSIAKAMNIDNDIKKVISQ